MATVPEPLELIPFARMTVHLRRPHHLAGTPVGDRLIFEVEDGVLEGERVRGIVKGSSGADWFTLGPDGTGRLDVRALLETDDGALVFVQYTGRTDLSAGQGPVYATPVFETGDERYRWLNRIQVVGKGALDGGTLTYDLYELR